MVRLERRDDDGGLHYRVTAFFSPGAAEVARALGATRCPRPARTGLEFVAGDPGGRRSSSPMP